MFDFLFVTSKQCGAYKVYWNEKTGEWSANCDPSIILHKLSEGYFSDIEKNWLYRFVYDAPYVFGCRWSK